VQVVLVLLLFPFLVLPIESVEEEEENEEKDDLRIHLLTFLATRCELCHQPCRLQLVASSSLPVAWRGFLIE